MSTIKLFETRQVRSLWDQGKEAWFFSIVDMVAVLTDSPKRFATPCCLGKPLLLWRTGMKTDSEIRMQGMQALIGSLGLIEAERFLMSVNQDRFDYTEWRRSGLPAMSMEQLAVEANKLSSQLDK